MKKHADKINQSCQEFNAALPNVRSNLQTIPDEGTYIDKWLKIESVEIKKTSISTRTAILDVVKEIHVSYIL
jgi:hypothetical protein